MNTTWQIEFCGGIRSAAAFYMTANLLGHNKHIIWALCYVSLKRRELGKCFMEEPLEWSKYVNVWDVEMELILAAQDEQ